MVMLLKWHQNECFVIGILCNVDLESEPKRQDPLRAGIPWFSGKLWWGECIFTLENSGWGNIYN